MSGMELLQKLKDIRNFSIPVILLTKDNNYDYNQKYIEQGFDDYIIKPLNKENLLDKLDKFMK
jgi:YesN/AraC family two-component response regulator